MMKVDFLVVGAGFTGSVIAERIATQLDKRVLIVEKRNHIGGNAYDCYNKDGILIHKYGPHIFHTNSSKIWNYLSKFAEWRRYFHRVMAEVEGRRIPVPFNLNSLYACFPKTFAEQLEALLISSYGFGRKISIIKLKEKTEGKLNFLAQYIYDNVFVGYTKKHWDLSPEDLAPSVIARVPVFISKDNRYFQDTYQGLPLLGYTNLFRNMLSHENIKILLNTNYKEIVHDISFDQMIYTGPADYFFDYMHGKLPYRSIQFKYKTIHGEKYQEVAVINYPNAYDFTRVTEFKQLTGQKSYKTTTVAEYPQAHKAGENEPYYPIPTEENQKIFKKYRSEMEKINPEVLFAGRLADFQYYDMDQAVGRALTIFKHTICSTQTELNAL
jgi:UDP-galactopyranose mutase